MAGWPSLFHLICGRTPATLRPGLDNNNKVRWKCGSDIQCSLIHWITEREAHTKNIPSHSIVVNHPYT